MSDDKIINFADKKASHTGNGNMATGGMGMSKFRPVGPMGKAPADAANPDPQMTVEINNDELVGTLDALKAENSPENLMNLLNLIIECRVLVIATFAEKKRATPLVFKNEAGEFVQPVYTDKNAIPDRAQVPHDGVINMPFESILRPAVTQENLNGIVINNTKQNIFLKKDILLALVKFLDGKKSGEIPAEAKLNVTSQDKSKTTKVMMFKDGEQVEVNPDELDPQTTIEVQNPALEDSIDIFHQDKTNENLTKLLNILVNCHVLIPAKLNDQKIPMPLTINTKEGETLQPVFSQKDKIPADLKSQVVMNVPFVEVLNTVMKNLDTVNGIGINPFGKAVILKRQILEQLQVGLAKNEEPKSGAQSSKLSPEELEEKRTAIRERIKFETSFLPKKFFEDTKGFVEEICQGKEAYLDGLFEEAYEDPRMYPYLVDEFRVMPISISDTRDVVIINMPAADASSGTAESIYMIWDKESGIARYIAIQKGTGKGNRKAVEVKDNAEIISIGDAPKEGTELNFVLGMLEE